MKKIYIVGIVGLAGGILAVFLISQRFSFQKPAEKFSRRTETTIHEGKTKEINWDKIREKAEAQYLEAENIETITFKSNNQKTSVNLLTFRG